MKRISLPKAINSKDQIKQFPVSDEYSFNDKNHNTLVLLNDQVSIKEETIQFANETLSKIFFQECFENSTQQNRQHTFHRLGYKSLDKLKKPLSNKNSIHKLTEKTNCQSKNQQNFFYQNRNEKNLDFMNNFIFIKNHQSAYVSRPNQIDELYYDKTFKIKQFQTAFEPKVIQYINKKLCSSENLRKEPLQKKIQDKITKCKTLRKYSDQNMGVLLCNLQNQQKINAKISSLNRKYDFSTFDSQRAKQSISSNKSKISASIHDIASKLCQSIKMPSQDIIEESKLNPLESNIMKDSFINKLNISNQNQRPSISYKYSKTYNFIRLPQNFIRRPQHRISKNQKIIQQKQTSIKNYQNQQQIRQYGSKQTIPRQVQKQRIRSLNECSTIISRYNKTTSQQKQVLQQSNIIFQASKFPKHQNQQKFSNQFIELDNINSSDNSKCFVQRKVKHKFIRKNGKIHHDTLLDRNNQEIRFDLDTFIQYGPLY